jgi:hypothetical protein
MRRATIAILLVGLGTALASDHPETARKLTLRTSGTKQSLTWSVRLPPPPLPSANPLATGATLRIFSATGETASFDLPASGWTARSAATTFTFKNALAPAGPTPVRTASLKGLRTLKVTAKTSGLTLDEPLQGAVGIELAIGDDVYCSECTTAIRDVPGRYTAKLCRPPVACAGTVATTTSTTTTTFVPGQCGNGVVDQPSEVCDGADLGLCADSPIPFTVGCQGPGRGDECTCCGEDFCVFSPSFIIECCGPSQCQATGVGVGQRAGVCIPPTCTQDADCQGYRCVGGTCCGNAGQLCGVAGCCPDTGTTCQFVEAAFVDICCKAAGVSCSIYSECCSLSCTAGVCD